MCELVDDQFPAWQGLPIQAVDSQGIVRAIFRIGDQLAARFPLQCSDAEVVLRSLESELSAAADLLGRTRLPTDDDPGDSVAFAHDLPEFVRMSVAYDDRRSPVIGIANRVAHRRGPRGRPPRCSVREPHPG